MREGLVTINKIEFIVITWKCFLKNEKEKRGVIISSLTQVKPGNSGERWEKKT